MRESLTWWLLQLFATLPLSAAQKIGAMLGRGASMLPNPLQRAIASNLLLCFPELNDRERRRLLQRTLIETGKTLTEMGALWLWDAPRVLQLVKGVSGEDEFRTALAHGRGAIIAGPHLGAWEMAGLYLSHNYPLTSLYRPPRLAGLDARVRVARERCGARLVPTNTTGVKALSQTLSRSEVVAILPDNNPSQGTGIFAPFFGIPANTMVLLPRLAAKHRVPVYFVYAERLSPGEGFHIHFRRGDARIGAADLMQGCTYLNLGVENCIRCHPEQYQWSYKRFKMRPASKNLDKHGHPDD